MSGGQSGGKGYLLQALICLLDSLQEGAEWTTVTIEPRDESEKVDITWTYPNRVKKVQVKHSKNPIGVRDAKQWAKQLETSTNADEYELKLLGNGKKGVPPVGNFFGGVHVPTPLSVEINALLKQASHDLEVYLTPQIGSQPYRPKVREMIVRALSHKLGELSTKGSPFTRIEFDAFLQTCLSEIRKSSTVPTSNSSKCSRLDQLEQCLALSRGNCIARWQAAGMNRATAIAMADDSSIEFSEELGPTDETPVRLVVGSFGSGKSLALELYYQSQVKVAISNPAAPMPVFLEAPSIHGSLADAIRENCVRLGDPSAVGARILIDRLDEVSTLKAQGILNEVRALTCAWPNTRAILASRPMRCLHDIQENVWMRGLDDLAAKHLVGRTASLSTDEIERCSWAWPRSVRDAIKTPIFAIMLGRYLGDGRNVSLLSKAGLVHHLVDSAIQKVIADRHELDAQFCAVAQDCIDTGGTPLNALKPRQKIDLLLQSGLVVEREGMLSFPLPILAQWFGARAILDEYLLVDRLWDYPGRIDRWRHALAVAIATSTPCQLERLLKPIAKRDPGVLFLITEDATSFWQLRTGAIGPKALDAAKLIRNTMQACVDGIGDLAGMIAPISPSNGSLMQVATRTEGEWLVAGWNMAETEPDIAVLPTNVSLPGPMKAGNTDLPGHNEMLSFRSGFESPHWLGVCGVRPGMQSAWAWRWVREHLQHEVKKILKPGHLLDLYSDDLVREAAWHTARSLLNRSSVIDYSPIPIEELIEVLPFSLEEFRCKARSKARIQLHRNHAKIELTALGIEVDRLIRNNIHEICSPLPTPDSIPTQRLTNYLPWEWYSEARMFERLKVLYECAITAYQQITKTWFAPFIGRLHRAATLPARITIDVDLNSSKADPIGDPLLRIQWEPLEFGSRIEVAVAHGSVKFFTFESERSSRLQELILRLRPDQSESLGTLLCHDRASDFFFDYPIRKTVFSWLEEDLKRISWLHH